MTTLKLLILAGGRSSRMGSPKHLLKLDDQPNYIRLLNEAQQAYPDIQSYISLAKGASHVCTNQLKHVSDSQITLHQIFDLQDDIGPAAGLLAALKTDSCCNWLVIACDYPLLTWREIKLLIDSYESPVTSFVNHEGYHEPLLAIWSSDALLQLKAQVGLGFNSPNRMIKQLGGKGVMPSRFESLINTNTPEQWEVVRSVGYKR